MEENKELMELWNFWLPEGPFCLWSDEPDDDEFDAEIIIFNSQRVVL